MSENKGKINVLKDTMLFVTNSIFEANIKKQTTKEEILKKIPEIYENADPKEIIKMLPYSSYLLLEEIMKRTKGKKGIIEIEEDFIYGDEVDYNAYKYLQETMILVARTKDYRTTHYVDSKVLKILERLYTDENRKIAKEYGELEMIILGGIRTYGMILNDIFKKNICKACGRIIQDSLLEDLCWKKLNLNLTINRQMVKWKDGTQSEFFTLFDIEDVIMYEYFDEIFKMQCDFGFQYKQFSKEEYIKICKEDFTENDIKIIEDFKMDDFSKEYFLKSMKRKVNLGAEITDIFKEFIEKFEKNISNSNIEEILIDYLKWYSCIPQYGLCGYALVEIVEDN